MRGKRWKALREEVERLIETDKPQTMEELIALLAPDIKAHLDRCRKCHAFASAYVESVQLQPS